MLLETVKAKTRNNESIIRTINIFQSAQGKLARCAIMVALNCNGHLTAMNTMYQAEKCYRERFPNYEECSTYSRHCICSKTINDGRSISLYRNNEVKEDMLWLFSFISEATETLPLLASHVTKQNFNQESQRFSWSVVTAKLLLTSSSTVKW